MKMPLHFNCFVEEETDTFPSGNKSHQTTLGLVLNSWVHIPVGSKMCCWIIITTCFTALDATALKAGNDKRIKTQKVRCGHTLQNDLSNQVSKKASTLSGDLLCLCDSGEVDCFYSGGVDGRIHAWSHNVTVRDPLYSTSAHNGRINVMDYSYATNLLISAGNDGTIQCRRVARMAKSYIEYQMLKSLYSTQMARQKESQRSLYFKTVVHMYILRQAPQMES